MVKGREKRTEPECSSSSRAGKLLVGPETLPTDPFTIFKPQNRLINTFQKQNIFSINVFCCFFIVKGHVERLNKWSRPGLEPATYRFLLGATLGATMAWASPLESGATQCYPSVTVPSALVKGFHYLTTYIFLLFAVAEKLYINLCDV